MSWLEAVGEPEVAEPSPVASLARCREILAAEGEDGLPFGDGDATAGSESELQAAVAGERDAVDLPLTIEASNYFANVVRRAAAGDTPPSAVAHLEDFLQGNRDRLWENSWVRFPRRALGALAGRVLETDLLADKSLAGGSHRADRERFFVRQGGEELLRVPVSYLVKLALADAVDSPEVLPTVRDTAVRLLPRFVSDNSSPETLSFHVVPLLAATGDGRALARETARRYLLTHLLIAYANRRFGLAERGQQAEVFFSPHPPVRQRLLNRSISDAFYRELFISPCLSGWDRGESKRDYMVLCHQVLSRSHLAAVAKLRDAGIITHDLVVLPETSNLSLANNGTHLSLGSRRLGALRRDPRSGFGAAHEKRVGDLVIKIAEHFLALFVGTYSAAPYRLDFRDFHPERVLGFLPHELDYTHLRMIWRRWKKKARNRLFGRPLTPFGPELLDRAAAALFRLEGDLVPDFRLLDYPVALMSTERSPALDGRLGNVERLKRDLDHPGVSDARMSLYLPLRLRELHAMGFSGVEGRHYSLFDSLEADLGRATDLQRLVLAFAFDAVIAGRLGEEDLPDGPFLESERRQVFFGAAIGIPTFYVRRDTPNRFLAGLVAATPRVRSSGRYPGYLRVHNVEYRRTLLATLRGEGAAVVERLGMAAALDDLERRLERPAELSAQGRLLSGILDRAGVRSPFALDALAFNRAAESYYRSTLRRRQLDEALDALAEDARALAAEGSPGLAGLGATSPDAFVQRLRAGLAAGGVELAECLEDAASFDTPRKIFERKIRYELCRPLPEAEAVAVSPADGRILVGSLAATSRLFLKGKLFDLAELLGAERRRWLAAFAGGDFAVVRLTPDRYHYNHSPVAGRVVDCYELAGAYHSCNPAAVVELATPLSKNRRAVTLIDTDLPGGTGVGRVAMVEVVALMIGTIVQCHSARGYDDPRPLEPGAWVERGAAKSLYRPGSSTDVVLFEPGRVRWAEDLVANLGRRDAASRFTAAFGLPAARWVARAVERKTATQSIGGAAFVCLLVLPLVVGLVGVASGAPAERRLPAMPVLAAVATAYVLGEGLGRLACISFGCCYGRPVEELSPPLRRLFRRLAFTFTGETKKIAYASGLAGVRVVAVQAVTSTLFVGCGLGAMLLFLEGRSGAAFLLAILFSQGWRIVSETLRADHRGGGRLTAYQGMALLAIGYALGLAAVYRRPGAPVPVDLGAGLAALWHPGVVLALELLFAAVFLYTGASKVTGSRLSFHVHRHRT